MSCQYHGVTPVACLKDRISAEVFRSIPSQSAALPRLPSPDRGDVSKRDVRSRHITEGWKKTG